MTIGKMTLGEMALGKMALRTMTFDVMTTWNYWVQYSFRQNDTTKDDDIRQND